MTNLSREQMEEAFSMAEANVALEGLDAHAHPLYATLKAKVLSGEMDASEMGDAVTPNAPPTSRANSTPSTHFAKETAEHSGYSFRA
jgi:hypothetical protein